MIADGFNIRESMSSYWNMPIDRAVVLFAADRGGDVFVVNGVENTSLQYRSRYY